MPHASQARVGHKCPDTAGTPLAHSSPSSTQQSEVAMALTLKGPVPKFPFCIVDVKKINSSHVWQLNLVGDTAAPVLSSAAKSCV